MFPSILSPLHCSTVINDVTRLFGFPIYLINIHSFHSQPFFHILASSIASEIGEDKPREIIATTLAAYALSSILTGLSFFLLGSLKLGVLVGFFPRHILVGCVSSVCSVLHLLEQSALFV